MENASKALLMAGGILLVMLIISFFLFAWGRFSEFYENNDELAEIDDISKFNIQFTNYQDRDVYGYELISLANKVADYNMRYSNVEGANNNEKYNPITMNITIPTNMSKEKFWYGNEVEISYDHLFIDGRITQSGTSNQIQNVLSKVKNITDFYLDEHTANSLAKSINSLILYDKHGQPNAQLQYYMNVKKMTKEQAEESAVSTYNSIVKINQVKTYDKMIENIEHTACILQYYEYSQFKKAIFKCTGIEYDDITGRVKSIDFNFEGRLK